MTLKMMLVLLAGMATQPAVLAQDMSPGRELAATCANCHGTDGRAVGDMKPLAGVAAATIIAMVAAYKTGNPPATIMHQIAKGYTDEQIRSVAAYFAAQKPAN